MKALIGIGKQGEWESVQELRSAFPLIIKKYSRPLYWNIRRIVLNHDDADDVLQNVFVKAWENLDKFQNKSKFSTWLYRIAVNESLDFIRRQKKTNESHCADLQDIDGILLADEYFDGDELQAQLRAAIACLPDVQRVVFNLRYFEEMKYSEMSKILDTSEGALKASYHIAVKKITEYFKDKG